DDNLLQNLPADVHGSDHAIDVAGLDPQGVGHTAEHGVKQAEPELALVVGLVGAREVQSGRTTEKVVAQVDAIVALAGTFSAERSVVRLAAVEVNLSPAYLAQAEPQAGRVVAVVENEELSLTGGANLDPEPGGAEPGTDRVVGLLLGHEEDAGGGDALGPV